MTGKAWWFETHRGFLVLCPSDTKSPCCSVPFRRKEKSEQCWLAQRTDLSDRHTSLQVTASGPGSHSQLLPKHDFLGVQKHPAQATPRWHQVSDSSAPCESTAPAWGIRPCCPAAKPALAEKHMQWCPLLRSSGLGFRILNTLFLF